MRVIAGSVKGRRLKGPPERSRRGKTPVTRPSSDLVRESLFSTLDAMGADFSRVLDLYAGSGALNHSHRFAVCSHCPARPPSSLSPPKKNHSNKQQ